MGVAPALWNMSVGQRSVPDQARECSLSTQRMCLTRRNLVFWIRTEHTHLSKDQRWLVGFWPGKSLSTHSVEFGVRLPGSAIFQTERIYTAPLRQKNTGAVTFAERINNLCCAKRGAVQLRRLNPHWADCGGDFDSDGKHALLRCGLVRRARTVDWSEVKLWLDLSQGQPRPLLARSPQQIDMGGVRWR